MKPDSETKLTELVVAGGSGCVDAFAALYERYYGTMVAVAYAIVADYDMAEDAAQETFAVACRDIAKLKKTDRFGCWLTGICRNTAKQMLRRRKSTACKNISRPQQEMSAESGNRADRNIPVEGALRQLAERDREVIMLRYYDAMTYRQMAELLGISTDAVHGRIVRAKRKIKRFLKQKGFSEDDFSGDDYERF